MRSAVTASALFAAAVIGVLAVSAEDKAEPAITIKQVMKEAMKDGLCKKVASGQASKEEADRLVELFTAMSKAEPPKGPADSWKAKTEALVAAAKACASGAEGAGAKLGAAANCKDCHGPHKPPAAG